MEEREGTKKGREAKGNIEKKGEREGRQKMGGGWRVGGKGWREGKWRGLMSME